MELPRHVARGVAAILAALATGAGPGAGDRPAVMSGDVNGEPGSDSLALLAAADHAAADEAVRRKIAFDLEALDAEGLAGPADGKVAVSYEFRIPDTAAARAAVLAIDPDIEITTGSPGRVDAGPGFALCIGSTHRPRHREILLALARLSCVERIARCHFE